MANFLCESLFLKTFEFFQFLMLCLFHRVMAVPGTVIYFTTYDRIKYKLGYREGSFKSIHIPVLAGSIARGINDFVTASSIIRNFRDRCTN